MSQDNLLIRDACLTAAAELGVRVVAPFRLLEGGGEAVEFIAHFPDFGGPKGMLVCHFKDWPAKQLVAKLYGFYCSGLHPDSYSRYDRETFVDGFKEWAWTGNAADEPDWCKS
jgi:hypothetical protein